ncbi:MAG: 4Fe-4S binding protein [Ignavibacteriae bacterium]|nr:4Fe-4S binding protein [Ignavibacteriota bacterium]
MDRREFITRPMSMLSRARKAARSDSCSSDAEFSNSVAHIATARCLAYNQTLCTLCFDKCPLQGQAIVLKEFLFPSVVEASCDGCGICEEFCPTSPAAIQT